MSAAMEILHNHKYCSNCLDPVDAPKLCAKCKTRVYCTRECQQFDWPFHKLICGTPHGEEGVDWEVRALPTFSGHGIVTLKDIPADYAVLVERSYLLSDITAKCGDGSSLIEHNEVVGFRTSFINHSCSPNAVHVRANNGIIVIITTRPIKSGNEIYLDYSPVRKMINDPDDCDFRKVCDEREKWLLKERGIICHPRCICKIRSNDEEYAGYVLLTMKLFRGIVRYGVRPNGKDKCAERIDKLLQIATENHEDIYFIIGVLEQAGKSMQGDKRVLAYIDRGLELAKSFMFPKSDIVTSLEKLKRQASALTIEIPA